MSLEGCVSREVFFRSIVYRDRLSWNKLFLGCRRLFKYYITGYMLNAEVLQKAKDDSMQGNSDT